MRAETLWQDRKYEVIKQGVETKKISLRQKQKFQHLVHVIMSDKDNVFIFKFQKKVMGGGTTYTELSKNVYMFEVEALNRCHAARRQQLHLEMGATQRLPQNGQV